MGVVNTIGFDKFPKQGVQLNQKVEVCFHYNTTKVIEGIIIRDDAEDPYITLIKLAECCRIITLDEYNYNSVSCY